MTASRACFLLVLAWAFCATTARAAIVISADEVWDGVANPHAADGVTLNNGVYTIPTSVTIAAGVNVYLNNPLGSTPSNSVTWEFLPGAGGLTFGDPTSTIDTYVGGRNLAPTTFTLNMNNNNIGGSVPGAGRIINAFALIDMESGDSMSVAINSQANVVLGEIDVTKIDATFSAINVVSQGLVDIGRLADRDTSAGGGSTFDINIRGETLVIGDIDTRNARVPTSNSEIGNVNLRALAQPENSTGAFTANTAAVNSVTLKGLINTNGPSSPNNKGNVNVTAVKVELTPTFNVDLNETGTFNVTAGAVGPGFPQSALFVNNSPVTPTSVVYTVFHDNLGPTDIEWDANASGNWHNDNNWSVVGFPANSNAIPNSNTQTAIFGSAITAPQTIYMNTATTAKGVRFNTASKVAVAGTTGITMDANTGSASLEVQQGSHEVQVPLTLNDPTNVTTAAGTQLDLNGIINMQGNTLTVSGAGQVNVNNQVTGGGSITSSGTLGTAGLTGVTGNLTSTGVLDIDIAGSAVNFYDAFSVTGSATLSGTLNVDLTNGYTLSGGESFTILTAGSVSAAGLTLGGPDASAFTLIKNPTSLVLQAAATGDADFDNDGDVDGSDFLTWQRGLGPGANATGDADGNGQVNGADLSIWRNRFGQSATAAAGAVPEPASAVLVLSMCIALGAFRQRRVVVRG